MQFSQPQWPIWSPSQATINQAILTRFMQQSGFKSYDDLYQFSIENHAEFWSLLWDFCQIIATTQGSQIVANWDDIEKVQFFPEAKLNFAENLRCQP